MTGRILTSMSVNDFSDASSSLLCFQVILCGENNGASLKKFGQVMSFNALQVCFEIPYLVFPNKLDKLFLGKTEGKDTVIFGEKI